jgi:hypothetical protein
VPNLRALVVLVSLNALGACESLDRRTNTDFVPAGQTFKYKGFADAIFRLDTEEGEKYRMRLLEEWLKLNNGCPKGFTIISRTPVRRSQGILSDIFDVYYEGRCN